jgi:hypothetical protein
LFGALSVLRPTAWKIKVEAVITEEGTKEAREMLLAVGASTECASQSQEFFLVRARALLDGKPERHWVSSRNSY